MRGRNPQCRIGRALLSIAGLGLLGGGSCGKGGNDLPTVGTPQYAQIVNVFYAGAAALKSNDPKHIPIYVPQVPKLAPGEPAGWANLGLMAMRNGLYDVAAKHLAEASRLAPGNSKIEWLLGILEGLRGKFAEAVIHYRNSIASDPTNLRASWALVEQLERQNDPASETEARSLVAKLVEAHPNNLTMRLELLRLADKQRDRASVQAVLKGFEIRVPFWPAQAQNTFKALQKAAISGTDLPPYKVMELRNVTVALPEQRQSYEALKGKTKAVGEPIETFLKLPNPPRTPSPPDMAMIWNTKPSVSGSITGKGVIAQAVALVPELPAFVADKFSLPTTSESPLSLLVADGRQVQVTTSGKPSVTLTFPGGTSSIPPSGTGLLVLDWNYDFRMDIALAGVGGLKLYQQGRDGTFTDITMRAGLPASVTGQPLFGLWAADIDLDGDLDIMTAPINGTPFVVRNNGDSTFKVIRPFTGVSSLRDFAICDVDNDGDPDAALLDAQGKLQIFTNERSGIYIERSVPESIGTVAALTVADADNEGTLDFVLLNMSGTIARLADKNEGKEWTTAELARWPSPPSLAPGSVRLFAADLDNNGSLDLTVSSVGTTICFLSDAQGIFKPLAASLPYSTFWIVDLNEDGRLDFVGTAADGKVMHALNQGTKNYHWQIVRSRAHHIKVDPDNRGLSAADLSQKTGDDRINSFCIGGEIEIRAGMLVQKLPVTSPSVHFGLGENIATPFGRYVWPNGGFQAEFDLKQDHSIVTEQRLDSSCPWLFAWNGTNMAFVTDFIWRSPLGLKINAQDTAGVATTEDWVKIRADQLAPKDGYYDLRVTAELWETHFFDHISLLVVDHPKDSEVYVDERFVFPPPKMQLWATGTPRPIKRALDDNGQDVTGTLRERDGQYLDTFGRGQYQGVTRDHTLEVEIGEDAPKSGPLYLLAYGWIHPTNSSINVALGQGRHEPPRGLSMEVLDGKGQWVVVNKNLGFPSGKNKTILIPLEGVFKSLPAGAPRRVRLRTNLEVYWDQLQVAAGLPNTTVKTQRLLPETADLHFRGFSATHTANSSSPELPDYDTIKATNQQWRDLIGWYTRYGDVRELLKVVDDRYVIMNAGDEMSFRFAAPSLPPAGWVRDYVLIGDGWEKDGNLNTTFSKTVLPLPSHSDPKYNTPPGRLEDDPVYRRHSKDWVNYHTRFVAPDEFKRGLR